MLTRIAIRCLVCVALLVALCSRGLTAETPWKVGLAQVKITPQKPVYLEGYAARNKPFDRVEHDLYLKAMVLEDAAGGRAVLVTSDLVGFRPPLVDAVCRRIEKETGISRSGILLNASHTHCGPIPSHFPYPVSVWQLGDDLTLVALSGEVVVDYVPLLQDALGHVNLWVAAYSHDVFGYIPSLRVLREGGYETRGIDTDGVGLFAPGTQEVIVRGVRELAKEAGRKVP